MKRGRYTETNGLGKFERFTYFEPPSAEKVAAVHAWMEVWRSLSGRQKAAWRRLSKEQREATKLLSADDFAAVMNSQSMS
jgi:hypothetical protein